MKKAERMKLRELRRQCERFTRRVIAEGADPDELAGLLLGSMMRVLRDRGISRDLYLQACALLWENDNPTDVPVDDEDGITRALLATPSTSTAWISNRVVGDTWRQRCMRCSAEETRRLSPVASDPVAGSFRSFGQDEDLIAWRRAFEVAHEGCTGVSQR